MPDLHIFKVAVGMADPVALQDHNVAIRFGQNVWYRRVDFLEAIPEFQCINLGAVPANNQVGPTNVVNLEAADDEFCIWRWYVIDDVQILLFHPANLSKNQLRNIQAPYDAQILINDPNLVSSEIAVWEDNRPAMRAINGYAWAMLASRIRAIGFRFHTVDLETAVGHGLLKADEKKVISQLKSDPANAKMSDWKLLEMALKEGRLPVTDIWCSGRPTAT